MLLHKIPERESGKNRAHVDIRSADRIADIARLAGLGAHDGVTRRFGDFTRAVTEDPEGNELRVA